MRARIVIILGVLAAFAVNASAQRLVRQYAVKFVCGKASDEQSNLHNFAPGEYFTTINVHNPALGTTVSFQKKFALADPAEQGGVVSPWFHAGLKPDQAMQIDCRDIYDHLHIPFGSKFIDGFAVIQRTTGNRELDVVGVYTAAPPGGNAVATMHMERVAGRLTH